MPNVFVVSARGALLIFNFRVVVVVVVLVFFFFAEMDPQRQGGSPRRTTLSLSPLLGGAAGRIVTARRSWSPQHQSSLEVPTPRQIQSARNSLAATLTGGGGGGAHHLNEVFPFFSFSTCRAIEAAI